MDYRKLGRSGLMVSPLCLGTMNFGPHTSEEDSFRIMDRALELGINFFDTANVYGWQKGEGITEKIIGKWFSLGGGRRDKVVLATKVYGSMGDWPNTSKLSAFHIRKACEDSLIRLQTDHIDLYQMHHVDRNTPWEEIWQAYERLFYDGKITYAGSSNFAGWHIAMAEEAAKARSFMGLVSEQSHYNLLTRQVELEVLPACEHYGLGVIPWSPLAGGLLGGVMSKQEGTRRQDDRNKPRIEQHAAKLQAFEDLAGDLGQSPANVALAWLLHQKAVAAPIIGPRTLEQLESAIPAAELKLNADTLALLNDIFPGPGGPAPEAYAW